MLTGLNFLLKIMPNKKNGVNLIELIVCMILMSLVVLGFFSIEIFSRHHVVSSDRRSKLQVDISYSIEYISKYVQQSTGDVNNPPITLVTISSSDGFRVRVDLNDPKTPGNLSDDTWVNFYLDGYELKTLQGATTEVLTNKIVGAFEGSVMPEFPDKGFYVSITDQGTAVDIGLVGRYDPASAASADNPQIAMKTRLVSPSASAH